MELLMMQLTANTVSVNGGAKGTGSAKGNAGSFPQLLVTSVNEAMNSHAGASAQAASANQPGLLATLGEDAADNEHSAGEEGMLELIAQLLQLLQGQESGTAETELTDRELQAVLEQLGAMNANGSLGLSFDAINQMMVARLAAQGEAAGAQPDAGNIIRAGLQDVLQQLQQLIPSLAQNNKGLLQELNKQLEAMQKLLQPAGASQQQPVEGQAAPRSQQAMPTVVHLQAESGSNGLQKLMNQPLHASVLAVVQLDSAGQQDQDMPAMPAPATLTPSAALQQQPTVQQPVQQPAVPQVPVDQLTQYVQGMAVKQFQLATGGNGISEARILLQPEHLGQIDIKISIQNGIVTAQFMAENPLAKDMIENQINQLRLALHAQGLQVEKIEVAQSHVASQLFQEQRHHGSSQQQGGQQQDSQHGRERAAAGVFGDELLERAGLEILDAGQSINVVA